MKISLSDHFTYRRLLKFILPTVIMMIVTSIYGIVDGLFVSNFVGKNSFAALNLIMPIVMAIGAFGFMIGTGGSAYVAKTLGEGKKEEANQYFSMLIYVTLIVGCVFAVLGFIFMRPIALMIGATELTIDDCVLYGRIIIAVIPMFMIQNCFQSFLVVAEKPYMGLKVSIMAGITNIVLDFLFVYIFKFGLAGAAIATAMSQIVGAVIPMVYFARKNTSLLQLTRFKMDWRVFRKSCSNGSSEMLTNLSLSFVSILYNIQLMKVAAENGVAAYGVIMYVNFIFLGFFFGFSIGSGPLISYNYGADNRNELKGLYNKSLVIISAASIIMLCAAQVLAFPLAKIFVGYDTLLLDMTCSALKLYSLSFLVCGFNIFGSAFFTALNNGLLSAIISFLRTFVFQVAAILILPLILGVNGIWLALVVAEGLTVIVTITFVVKKKGYYHY